MNIIDKFHNWRRKHRWNRQYKSGRWDNLKGEKEIVRYQKIIDYIYQFGNKNPKILDLGCGEGILCERMTTIEYSRFLGMDFSSVSIEKAKQLKLNNAEFICADIQNFKPDHNFDVIVFNEVFYYIPESEKQNVLARMIGCLNEGGIIITSIYREGHGCWNYFEGFNQLAFDTVITEDENRYWKVGVYKK